MTRLSAALSLVALLVTGCTRANDVPKPPPGGSDMAPPIVAPLTLATAALPEATVAVSYAAKLTVSGDHAGEAQWSITNGTLPPGMRLDSSVGPSVRIVGTTSSPASYSFTVAVDDSAGEHDAHAFTIVVGDALAIEGSLPAATEGQPFVGTLTARGGHDTHYTWSVSSGALPSGITLVPKATSATLSGTPQPGTADFSIMLADGAGGQVVRAFTVHVVSAMSISHGALPQAVQGRSFSLPLTVAGGTGHYTWSLGGSVPIGLAISGTGSRVTLGGTPTSAGSYSFVVYVSDDNLGSATLPLTVTVAPALHIVTRYVPDAQQAVAYSATLTAAGGASTAYLWSVASGALPPGLKLSTGTEASSPSGILSGAPTQSGSYTFTVAVTTTSGDSASASYTMLVGNSPPAITTTTLPDATFGTSYDATISGTSVVGGAVTWKIVGGALPPGITLAASSTTSAHLVGTPKLLGAFAFTVQMSDGGGGSERALGLDVVRRAGVEILAGALPPARVGRPYSATVASRGSTGAVTWKVAAGALPAGLTIAGSGTSATISGTPTAGGFATFTLGASDGASSDACPFAIRVAPARMYIGFASATASGSQYASAVHVREIQTRSPGIESTLAKAAPSSAPFTPTFSPSGDWISYVLRDDTVPSAATYTGDLRGDPATFGAPTKLYNSDDALVWSSNDARAAVNVSPAAYDLDVIDFSGATPSTAKVAAAPTSGLSFWSPDGTRLAYFAAGGATLYLYATSGATTTIALPAGVTGNWDSWMASPWLPDGRGLYFEGRDSAQPNPQLFYLDATAGAQPLALSDPSVPFLGGNLYASPDGGGLVFLSTGPDTAGGGISYDAWYVDLTTRQLARAVKIDAMPDEIANVVWSPDSKQILFPRSHGLWAPLMIARAQIGVAQWQPVNLGSLSPSNSDNATWAADSRHLLFCAGSVLYELSIDGTAPLLLGIKGSNQAWSLSSTRRAYVYNGAEGLSYVVAGNGTASTPIVLDRADVNTGNIAVSRTLETVFYGAQSNALYMIDLSGTNPGVPAQVSSSTAPTSFSISD